MRSFEYRLYPNKEQQQLLAACLSQSRDIYNEMLTTAITQYKEEDTFPSFYDLEKAFKGKWEHVPATTVQMLAYRLNKALKRFLAAKELGMKVGFPRFKQPNQWSSIQLRQYGYRNSRRQDAVLAPDEKHLLVPIKLGNSIKIKMHRPLEGTPKTVHLVQRADGHWYALIVCETEPQNEHLPSDCNHPDIGIDVGLKSFLTDSDGNTIKNPRYYRKSQKILRRKQLIIRRRKKDSHRYHKAVKNAAKTHLKIARQRRDFHFKTAKRYSEQYRIIAVEKLDILNLVHSNRLAKSILDASWGAFLDILTVKAENAGHQVIRVNPMYTSQKCHKCGEIVQKSLSVRTHICPYCGYVEDRDVNSAKNILVIGQGMAFIRQRTGLPAALDEKPSTSV